MADEIFSGQNIIDSRDIIARIEELSALADDEGRVMLSDENGAYADADLTEELNELRDLAEQASGSGDWPGGEILILDDFFAEYAQQYAEDVGVVSREVTWPYDHIDWDAAAADLQADYTAVEFSGLTYWIRS